MKVKYKYSKGSQWNRWDLHLHTPKSIVQQYGGDTEAVWDKFIKQLAELPKDIKAIAVTDYLFCDGYKVLLKRRSEFPNIDLLMPNIEFRLNTFSGTENNKKRHNFHILFDPSVPPEVIEEQFLNGISKGYKIADHTEWEQAPTRRSLEELGKAMKANAPATNSIQNKTDLEVGFDNITYDRDDLLKLLKKSPFKGRYLTAIGYSEWDQAKWDQSAAEKRDLINSSNFCLTCLDDPAKIALNKENLASNNLQTPILHSSDSHDFSRLNATKLWIKADPTFAGLKQVLNEPEHRLFMGDSPPNYRHEHKIIKKISIPTSNGWFEEGFEIELNEGLVTIIGGRGSGKSALAEAIAYGAGSKDVTENSFVENAKQHKSPITGTKIQLEWGDDSKSSFEIGKLHDDQGMVCYLPQSVVEDLCSPGKSEKLQAQIERVIFDALDETEKMWCSNFEELKTKVLEKFQFEKAQLKGKIFELNGEMSQQYKALKGLPEKEALLKKLKEDMETLKKSLPELPKEAKADQDELLELNREKNSYEEHIIGIQNKINEIQKIGTKIKLFEEKITEFNRDISDLLKACEVTNEEAFTAKINGKEAEEKLAKIEKSLYEQVKLLKDSDKKTVAAILNVNAEALSTENYAKLIEKITKKQKETQAFETQKMKYQKQRESIVQLENNIKALTQEIEKIKTESNSLLKTLWNQCVETYCDYFDLLKREKKTVEELYAPLQESLSKGTDTDKKLKFNAKLKYQIQDHEKRGIDMIDRSRKGNFRSNEGLNEALSAFYETLRLNDFSSSSVKTASKTLLAGFTKLGEEKIKIEDQLKSNYYLVHFLNWLYDPSYFDITSSLTFDGTEIDFLSPGQKGIILLMLFLEVDKTDQRPLIVDQPEENLDNLSVYNDLIRFFKNRKDYRQIIMVTHNANLVVNTDSEQIIAAKFNGKGRPRLSYVSGSLENKAEELPNVPVDKLEDGILEKVCDVLEGGNQAFKGRGRKYAISPKIHP
ncbi:MAG: AAA family ATPase [Candidatus Gracilibacteria bacterium]